MEPLVTVDIHRAGYEKGITSIQDVQFSIRPGDLIGLIGPNGAGKSTAMKAMLGVMPFSKGNITFQKGCSYVYIPERPVFYHELTMEEHLRFAAASFNIDEQEAEKRARLLLKEFNMEDALKKLPRTFSKGMQQKMLLILAFLVKPSLFIIDEPFIGLDPNAMKTFLQKITDARAQGAGILMSTHVLDTAERTCDRFLLMSGGTLIGGGTFKEIKAQCNLSEGTLFDCFHSVMGAGR
ncbi:ABC transporter ATP-binding protein [Bacillus marinisedimentorum]|uniref:ABC transporter ATP-binding protein n=1 Tax=Bacillus marinisedimentorum TaxID=1821260 RepID=UPI0008731BB9|nr:ABC transporter ATP-binding protein [Bacillus marinisedimentorum]